MHFFIMYLARFQLVLGSFRELWLCYVGFVLCISRTGQFATSSRKNNEKQKKWEKIVKFRLLRWVQLGNDACHPLNSQIEEEKTRMLAWRPWWTHRHSQTKEEKNKNVCLETMTDTPSYPWRPSWTHDQDSSSACHDG